MSLTKKQLKIGHIPLSMQNFFQIVPNFAKIPPIDSTKSI